MSQKHEGDIFKIPLGDGTQAYAIAFRDPLFGFFDIRSEDEVAVSEIEKGKIIFCVWVMKYAVSKGIWKKVGTTSKFDGMYDEVSFYKQDAFNGRLTSYTNGVESPIDYEAAQTMEAAAVWDPEHVEDRLRDHFAGVPNKWVESLRPKRRN
ncbi:Imm26 family immunity protein [Mesorhizobium sp. 1M-11]|uniref:Imm26 family immunity protein n=1 Tax=Mesorhizobium sp. 1M-11 TaxID=1529006 RepID=UPI0006C74401|nr:Imm26 family immunity protein [Mesorhizobium sp. 1M-11]